MGGEGHGPERKESGEWRQVVVLPMMAGKRTVGVASITCCEGPYPWTMLWPGCSQREVYSSFTLSSTGGINLTEIILGGGRGSRV